MAAELLRRFGFDARRGQQFSGSKDSPDVVHGIPDVHLEVKCVERLNVQEAMEQALRDCGGKRPVVLHKRNGKGWLATIQAEDLLRLLGGDDFSDL